MWNCPDCETQNSEQFFKCEVCGTLRSNTAQSYPAENILRVPTVTPKSNGQGVELSPSLARNKRITTIGLIAGAVAGLCLLGFSVFVANGLRNQVAQSSSPIPSIEALPRQINPTNTPEIALITTSSTPQNPVTPVPIQVDKNPSTQEVTNNPISPEQFIRNYFTAINDRSYEQAWSMLSKKFQSSHTYDEYTAWWDTVDKVEIILIETRSQNDYEVSIYVEADYHYKNGVTTTGHTKYKLIRNNINNSWLFDPN